jgi:GAF domain-containing protein
VFKEIEVRANDWSWYLMRILPYRTAENVIDGLVLIFVDITRLKKSEIMLAAHNTAMDMALKDSSLEELSDGLIRTIETQSNGIWCSISLFDEKNMVLRHGAAPNLPDDFNRVLDGIKVEANASEPCALAAYHKKHIILNDIPNDVNDTEFHKLALKYDLKACWAQPIYSQQGKVLGTFTIYYKKAHQPTTVEEELINQTVPLIGIAMERKKGKLANAKV